MCGLQGSQVQHLRQLKDGCPQPALFSEDYITPIPEHQSNTLARGALHFACKLAAWLSTNEQAKSLKDRLNVWYQTKGKEYTQLDKNAQVLSDWVATEEEGLLEGEFDVPDLCSQLPPGSS